MPLYGATRAANLTQCDAGGRFVAADWGLSAARVLVEQHRQPAKLRGAHLGKAKPLWIGRANVHSEIVRQLARLKHRHGRGGQRRRLDGRLAVEATLQIFDHQGLAGRV